ncbi:hypothetical protein F511_21950 [Dorcoceras hygrometricum]|uniref:Uncharacterized protein n=1 Tax=Dorcoceras hygrometricum TaxID=472368 RepID=A0A2Z7AAM7_9LAMI|nr:hypothetical protein F511_21950 [Dorcoceras hygrometricum]
MTGGRLLRQPALEGLTRSAWTDSPRKTDRSKSDQLAAAAAAAVEAGGGSRTPQNPPQVLNTLSLVSVRESRIQYLCDPKWFRDTASRGPTTIVAPESQFRTCPSDHDSIGYPRMSASGESSTTMHRLLHASGSHPIPPPNDPKTNQYNQDLGLIHSTNGNHLESPNEGSSIDHQVTIYLHAQNITMFPTNETCRNASLGIEKYRNLVKSTLVNGTVATYWCLHREKPAVGFSHMQLLVLHRCESFPCVPAGFRRDLFCVLAQVLSVRSVDQNVVVLEFARDLMKSMKSVLRERSVLAIV